jgi:hypothetical protein
LPATFQDAITTTRRLEIRYLWIDTLCFLQDDLEDWAANAGNMSAIYSNATIVLAATWSHDSY